MTLAAGVDLEVPGKHMRDWRLTGSYRSTSGEVRWAQLGAPGAEAVVLLHGTPFSSFIWRQIASALAHHHRVYVWDMPGYGASEMTDGQNLSLGALAAVFADLLKHWGVTEPLVVAHDSGGAVALGAHLLHGARYRRLALVDVVALAPWGSPFFELVGEHAETFGALPSKLHRALLREYVNSASGEAAVRPVLPVLRPGTDQRGRRRHRGRGGSAQADRHVQRTCLGPACLLDLPRHQRGAGSDRVRLGRPCRPVVHEEDLHPSVRERPRCRP